MKLTVLLTTLLCTCPALAIAATDWTPYLKPMQQGCGIPNPTQKLPTQYKASIIKKTVKGNPKNEGEDVTATYQLKDATAFGLPIKAVAFIQGYEDLGIQVYFYTADFLKLRPLFKTPAASSPDITVSIDENTSSGYLASAEAFTSLTFDKKSKSITCRSGV